MMLYYLKMTLLLPKQDIRGLQQLQIFQSYPEFVDKKPDELIGRLMFVRLNDNDFQLVAHKLTFPLNFSVSTRCKDDSIKIIQVRIQGVEKIIRGKNDLFLK